MFRSLPLFVVALSSLGPACEWDRDTLAEEAKLGRDYVATVVGRFPRNPPLFYAMRRDRLLAKSIKTTGDYDDLAVAYDKLGDPLSALVWIDRKPSGDAESRYRRLANRSTFLVHAWLAGKADSSKAKEGLESLKQAVRLNPNAHFGREAVQIKMVEALLNPAEAEFGVTRRDDERAMAAREAEGYAGIIRLGAGWESPDVFRAFAFSLASAGLGAVGVAASERADELARRGAKVRLDPKSAFYGIGRIQEIGALQADTRTQFVRLRAEADAWQSRRTEFMLTRMRAGRHPDTDAAFWQGWRDGESPTVQTEIVRVHGQPMTRGSYRALLLTAGSAVATPFLLLAWFLRRRSIRPRAS